MYHFYEEIPPAIIKALTSKCLTGRNVILLDVVVTKI